MMVFVAVIPAFFGNNEEDLPPPYLQAAPPPALRFIEASDTWDNSRLLSLKQFEEYLEELRLEREAEALAKAEAAKGKLGSDVPEKLTAVSASGPGAGDLESLDISRPTVISSLTGVVPGDREDFLRSLPGTEPDWFKGKEFLFHYRQDIDPDSDQQIEIPFIFEGALQQADVPAIPSSATLIEE